MVFVMIRSISEIVNIAKNVGLLILNITLSKKKSAYHIYLSVHKPPFLKNFGSNDMNNSWS